MLELLFWAWAVVALLAFVWTGPWILKNLWCGEIELFAFCAWPILCALTPILIVFGFLVMGWEKITGKEV